MNEQCQSMLSFARKNENSKIFKKKNLFQNNSRDLTEIQKRKKKKESGDRDNLEKMLKI